MKGVALSRSQRGFTLIEVLVATLILAVSMAGLMSALIIAAKNSGGTINKNVATYQATEFIEELRNSIAEDPSMLSASLYDPAWHLGCDMDSSCACDISGNLTPGGCAEQPGCYALLGAASPGVKHWIDPAQVPADFKANGGCVGYSVVTNVSGGQTYLEIKTNVVWSEPQL